MSATIKVIVNGHPGELVIWDAEPSVDILKIIYPDARIIAHDVTRDQWIVVVDAESPGARAALGGRDPRNACDPSLADSCPRCRSDGPARHHSARASSSEKYRRHRRSHAAAGAAARDLARARWAGHGEIVRARLESRGGHRVSTPGAGDVARRRCAICGAVLTWDPWAGPSWSGGWVDDRGVEHPVAADVPEDGAS